MDLNKMTGYALVGLRTDADGHLDDPRINLSSPLLTGTASLAGYLAELTGVDAVLARKSDLADDEPARAVVHDAIGGIPGVLIIRPVASPAWHRTGDVVDRASELGTTHTTARLEPLPGGLWPFSSQFMDADTGDQMNAPVLAWVRATDVDADGASEVDGLTSVERDALAQATTGFDSFEEATRRVVPDVPSAIRTLVRWGNLFTDPATVAQMRPALYTWWS